MNVEHTTKRESGPREGLLAGGPLDERKATPAGIPTAIFEGGEGPPIVLLHGPGEFAAKWLRVAPDLVSTHRVVAPDLPCHGASGGADEPMDLPRLLDWLDALIEDACPTPPVLVGHVLGGAIAARFAAARGERLDRLVLVDSLGLAPFRPELGFALSMLAFQLRPTEGSYRRFMRRCSYDLDELRRGLGDRWDDYEAYQLELVRGPGSRAAGRMLREIGLPRIPPEELSRIRTPTCLVWGRQDRAIKLAVAEEASARFGWPLHVVDDCADDPPRDRPVEFVRALRAFLASDGGTAARTA
jgi:pimeloyl-ACP methyl ester carboxylesterase